MAQLNAVASAFTPAWSQPGAHPNRTLIRRQPCEPNLLARQRAILARDRRDDLSIEFLGTMPLFSGHRVYPGYNRDWALINLADDPLYRDRDGFPVPKRILKSLRRIQRSGIEFDAIFAAHEVPAGSIREDRPIDAKLLAPPPPAPMQRLSQRLGNASNLLWMLAGLPLTASTTIGGMLNRGVAGFGEMIGLDPVLLGVAVARGRPVAPPEQSAWFYLGHWAYNQEQ
jgi:hypothetical protein